jgi:hypothetical protein
VKIKCVLPRTDFVPLVKTPRFWISPETVRDGHILDVDPEIGHQILASYPGAFQVLEYGKPGPKPKQKKVESDDLTMKVEEPQIEVNA